MVITVSFDCLQIGCRINGWGTVQMTKTGRRGLSDISRAQEIQQWTGLECRGSYDSQLRVTLAAFSNDVPRDLEELIRKRELSPDFKPFQCQFIKRV